MVVRPLDPKTYKILTTNMTDEDGAYYIVHEIQQASDGSLEMHRSLWFNRLDLQLARQLIFDASGNILTDARYSEWKPWDNVPFPKHIDFNRPQDAIGVKVAKHHHADETVDPDACDRAVSRTDEALIRPVLAEHLPAANGPLASATTCLYTMTPDGDFILDRVGPIVVLSPCSGHGFKFAPVIGEIAADLAIQGATSHDISRFRLGRFAVR